MNPAWSLRPFTKDDLPKVLAIEREIQVVPWSEDNFLSELSKPYSHFLVLTDNETDSKVAGYIVFWIMSGEGHILNLGVDLSYRGLGFAKRMARQAIDMSAKNDAKRVTLEVRKSNRPAIQLYQALNFTITHIRKSFYSNGEDAYVMTLGLIGDGIKF